MARFPFGKGIKVLAGFASCSPGAVDGWAAPRSQHRPGAPASASVTRPATTLREALTDSEVHFLQQVGRVPEEDILQNYEIPQAIAEGGFSTVYLAVRKPNAKPKYREYPHRLALKVLRRAPENEAEFRSHHGDLIAVEISYAKRFEQAGLKIFFVAVGADSVTIAMELAGERLPVKRSFAEYPLERRMEDLRVIASRLANIESEGIVHCDVKVENLLVTNQGPALVDFGFARCRGESRPAQGTPAYMSPESWHGRYETDAWGLGVVMYQLIFEGREPTAAEQAARINFRGAWLKPREDLRFAAAMNAASAEAPGEDFLERMENTQRQTWVLELLGLLEAMLQPNPEARASTCAALCKLEALTASMPKLGSADLQAILAAAIKDTDLKVGQCNKIF